MKHLAAVVGVIFGSARVLAAQDLGSLTGTVRDTTGVPLAGAEIILESKHLTTTSQGGFRFDSLTAGTHLITIRLVGYAALRSRVEVRTGVSHYDFVLQPAAHVLPTVYAESRRAGIFGTVGDSSFTPLAGVKVQLAGSGGGEATTDPQGHFAFPVTSAGQYVVRIAHPGYAVEHHFIELKKQQGVELAIRLRPSSEVIPRAAAVAFEELGHRLVANLSSDRLSAAQLERYGSLGLCDVNRIASKIREGGQPDSITVILNGTFILEGMALRDVCSWQAADVELVEFGDDICRDVTRTLVDMLGVWCVGFIKEPTFGNGRSIRTNNRIRAQRRPGPFVVIWERK